MPSRRFVIWFLMVITVVVFINSPRDGGTLKSFLAWAGFPWTFAFWDTGKLEYFSLWALLGDVALALGCATAIAFICGLSWPQHKTRSNKVHETA